VELGGKRGSAVLQQAQPVAAMPQARVPPGVAAKETGSGLEIEVRRRFPRRPGLPADVKHDRIGRKGITSLDLRLKVAAALQRLADLSFLVSPPAGRRGRGRNYHVGTRWGG